MTLGKELQQWTKKAASVIRTLLHVGRLSK
jgi:hypothetical protein